MVEPSTPADGDEPPDEVYCRDCGSTISERAEICPDCGVRQHAPPDATSDLLEGGNPVLAALLSALLPGLGQIYNRELERGLAFVVASMVSAFLVVFVIGIVIYPLVWVFAIYDAYSRAEQAYRDRVGPADPEGASTRERTHDDGTEDSGDDWGSGSEWDDRADAEESDRR